jgi:hypothetical protein
MSRENNELPIGKHNHGLLVHLTAAIDGMLQSCVFAAQGRLEKKGMENQVICLGQNNR